ncbi:hypothetical protein LEMLEM_LOCUS23205, partial [Lemmus lemmus]
MARHRTIVKFMFGGQVDGDAAMITPSIYPALPDVFG